MAGPLLIHHSHYGSEQIHCLLVFIYKQIQIKVNEFQNSNCITNSLISICINMPICDSEAPKLLFP